MTEVVNAVTNATRQRILDEQIAMVLHLQWDDFREMLQDSTHVAGNSKWPTDSRLIVTFVARLVRVGASLWRPTRLEATRPTVHLRRRVTNEGRWAAPCLGEYTKVPSRASGPKNHPSIGVADRLVDDMGHQEATRDQVFHGSPSRRTPFRRGSRYPNRPWVRAFRINRR